MDRRDPAAIELSVLLCNLMTHLALNIPGRKNSLPQHWQTIWESKLSWLHRVEMPEWEFADRREWVATLIASIEQAAQPLYLITH